MNISSGQLAVSAHSLTDAANHHEVYSRPRSRSWPGSRDVGQIPLTGVNTQIGIDEQESTVHQETPSIQDRRCLLPTGVQLREKIRKQIASELKKSKICKVFSTFHGYSEKNVKVRFTEQVKYKLRQEGLANELENSIVRTLRVKNTPVSLSSDEFFYFVKSVKVNNYLKELFPGPALSKNVFEISRPSHGTPFRRQHRWERVYAITHTVPEPLVDSRYLYIIPRSPEEEGLFPIAIVDEEKYLSKSLAVYFSDTINVTSAILNDKDDDDRQKVAKLTALLSPNTLSGTPDNTLPKDRQSVLTAGTFLNRIRGMTDEAARDTPVSATP